MKNKLKLSVLFVILLLLVSLGSATFYYNSYEKQKKISKSLEAELNSVKDQRDDILKQLDALNKEKTILQTKVKENDRIFADLSDKLEKEKEAKDLLVNEQKSLADKIEEIEQEKKKLGDTLNDKLQELKELQIRLDAEISEKNELEKKMADLSTARNSAENLDKIVVTPPDTEASIKEEAKEQKQAISSKVLLINREYGFLVLDIGKPSKVALGDVFEVFHENASMGKVKIEKIHDTMSAANFLEGFNINQVSEGDTANRIN